MKKILIVLFLLVGLHLIYLIWYFGGYLIPDRADCSLYNYERCPVGCEASCHSSCKACLDKICDCSSGTDVSIFHYFGWGE
jgi:hypothetical protein